MRVLCLNIGSSSLKWSLIDMPGEVRSDGGEVSPPFTLEGIVARPGTLDAVAHRLVHGGSRFKTATRIDDGLVAAVAKLSTIDPTHTPLALAGIAAARKLFPGLPQVACFDTAFHATLPVAAFTYAVPRQWTEDWGVRRYGFHGLSVAYAVRRSAELLGAMPEHLLVCHLGSGSSMTAVRDGKSLDTTMGFTPLEGVPMASRSGSVDPGMLVYLLRESRLTVPELDVALEQQSGLRGLFGGTGDLRDVLAAADAGDPRATLCYAVLLTGLRRGFGGMLASLGGLDAVIFTGGIGENQPRVRADLLSAFAWMGLGLDAERNRHSVDDAVLSPSGARIAVLRVGSREDLTMARETYRLLH